ncbi:phospholipase D-like domain-containing protein [Martelella soudanensis]|uniref:hypothetical protein n=1 Tax=unclassified Martelella TaxID=2629616 RepID=UPI0015DE4245|nr:MULTISPECIES: hypothetical protein [unclassified Martelella]
MGNHIWREALALVAHRVQVHGCEIAAKPHPKFNLTSPIAEFNHAVHGKRSEKLSEDDRQLAFEGSRGGSRRSRGEAGDAGTVRAPAPALVGASNFPHPGLTLNIELDVQVTGSPVTVLQEWFEEHWDEAEDVTPELLQVVEKDARDYKPFEVYATAIGQASAGDRRETVLRMLDSG